MKNIDILELKKTILEDNDADADLLRQQLKARKTFYLNIMSSPGAGKTSLILKLLDHMKDQYHCAVMEADIDSDVDAKTVAALGVDTIQLHTGGMCHLDADMSRQGMRHLASAHYDLIILENVGNLVCPAEFDTGAVKNMVILSVPEGDDKPLKYPLMFQLCDAVVVSKTDTLPIFDFDMARFRANVSRQNTASRIMPVSALNGEGIDAVCDWLTLEMDRWNKD